MNRLFRRGRNAFAMIIILPMMAIFTLTLAEPSNNAVRQAPLMEKVGEKYMVVQNHSGIDCYGSNFGDILAQPAFGSLWAQVIRFGDLPVPGSTEVSCADCHCDTCDVTSEHLSNHSSDVKASDLALHDFLNQGQYAPLLMEQRPALCPDCHASASVGAPGKKGIQRLSKKYFR